MHFRPVARDKLLFIIICIFLCKLPILTEPLNAYVLAVKVLHLRFVSILGQCMSCAFARADVGFM